MKKRRKTLVSCLLALTMLLGMTANCLAANTMTIEKVEILDENGRVKETYAPNAENIGVQIGAEVIRVTGKLADETSKAPVSGGAATYLAYNQKVDGIGLAEGETAPSLGNETIEYIDQMTTNADGTVSFTYRNRSTIPAETVIKAKVGGTDVASVASTSYKVENDLPFLVATGGGTFEKGTAPDDGIFFDISVKDNAAELPTKVVVKLNGVETSAFYEAGEMAIKSGELNNLEVGVYDVIVQAESFNEVFLNDAIVVNHKTLDDSEKEEAGANLDKAEVTVSNDTATLPSTDISAGGVSYTIPEEDKAKVTVEGNTVKLNTGVPFAKIDVTISVNGASDVKRDEVLYLIPEGTTVSYGNIGLHTTAGKDAFTYTAPTEGTEDEIKQAKKAINEEFTSFVQANNASIVEDIATALSIALDDTKAAKLPHFASALDFDGDTTKLTLAEYRIYRLLMSGTDSVHTFTAVNDARAALANNN